MQDCFEMNDEKIWQPDSGGYSPAPTPSTTDDSGYTMDGTRHDTILYTSKAYSFDYTNIPATEASKILNHIRNRSHFKLHYYDEFTASWKDDEFVCPDGYSLTGLTLKENEECWSSFSFTAYGVEPV